MILLSAGFYGFWDYWQLYHKVTFDMVNKVISVNPDVTTLDIKIDVYSDWKEWFKLDENSKSEIAIRSIGGDPTVGTDRAGDIYFLINGWRILYNPSNVRVVGILFSDDYETPWLHEDTLLPVYPTRVASLVNTVAPSLEGLNVPTASQNAIATRTELTPELGLIDRPISSRASQNSVDALQIDVTNIDSTTTTINTNVNSIDSKVDTLQTEITNIAADVNSILVEVTVGNMGSVLNDLIKYQRNKTVIDEAEFTLTIYNDDNVTPLTIFDLKDENGIASITSIFARIPRVLGSP